MRLVSAAVAAVVAVSVLPAAPAAQMFIATGRDTLRGLPGVEVIVEPLAPVLTRAGLDAAALRQQVERRLRAAGIAVYASQADNPSPAKAYLYVHLNGVALPAGGHAVAAQVHLRQTLRSPVTGSNVVDAMTWDAHGVVVVPASRLASVRDEVLGYVGRFVRDWQAVH